MSDDASAKPEDAAAQEWLREQSTIKHQHDNVIPLLPPDLDPSGELNALSEFQLAKEFSDKYPNDMRFVGQWRRWMVYNREKWTEDHTLRVFSMARDFIKAKTSDINSALAKKLMEGVSDAVPKAHKRRLWEEAKRKSRGITKQIESAKTVHNVVTLTKYNRRISLDTSSWDQDPWTLNTPGGTIDLRTGNMQKHNPLDYITKATAIAPALAKPVQFLAFLEQIHRGDQQMIRYLQRMFGYCLVGDPKEHQMFFFYGTGGNGKGVTINTMRNVLGDYGVEANIETFVVNASARHPTELADLRGARLVTCGETDEGQHWAEARIKSLTGGDPIKARFMRQDFFQYQPQFKLVLAGNHKPRLRNVDEAIQRRFRLVPFTFKIPDEEKDVNLGEKLKAEWPAILHWAIEGCLLWQTEGLTPPDAVAEATRGYLSQEDAITSWFADCLETDEKGFVYIKDLFQSWEAWARLGGEEVGTKRRLTQHLEDREPVLHIRKGARSGGFGFHGVRLRTETASDDDEEN